MTPSSDDEPASNEPPEFLSRPENIGEEDDDEHQNAPRNKGGYDGRIEQLLYENPDLQIVITHAGKNVESGGSYIAYTIRTGVGFQLRSGGTIETNPGKGTRGPPPIFRVQQPEGHLGQPSSYTDHSPNSREAHDGRLCCQTDESERGYGNNRPPKADVDGIFESLPENEGCSGRRSVVEISRSKCQLGRYIDGCVSHSRLTKY